MITFYKLNEHEKNILKQNNTTENKIKYLKEKVKLYENQINNLEWEILKSRNENNYLRQRTEYLEKYISEDKTANKFLYKIGDKIKIGGYEWNVIDAEKNKALILCREYIIKSNFYNISLNKYSIYWENCSIRKYLNDNFYKNLNADEKKKILATRLEYTTDKIFLLNKYEFLKAKKFISDADKNCCIDWWLRPDENKGVNFYSVGNNLEIKKSCDINCFFGVRPAMYIKNNS